MKPSSLSSPSALQSLCNFTPLWMRGQKSCTHTPSCMEGWYRFGRTRPMWYYPTHLHSPPSCWKNLNYHIRPDGPLCCSASRSGCHQACWHLGQIWSGPVRMLAFGSGSSQLLGIPISQLPSGSGLLVFRSGCCQPFGILISQLASIVRVQSAP